MGPVKNVGKDLPMLRVSASETSIFVFLMKKLGFAWVVFKVIL